MNVNIIIHGLLDSEVRKWLQKVKWADLTTYSQYFMELFYQEHTFMPSNLPLIDNLSLFERKNAKTNLYKISSECPFLWICNFYIVQI